MQDSSAFVNGFAIQIPAWLVLIVLAAILFGAWKLASMIWPQR
jgi:Sec-independent protein translocase protein TatA